MEYTFYGLSIAGDTLRDFYDDPQHIIRFAVRFAEIGGAPNSFNIKLFGVRNDGTMFPADLPNHSQGDSLTLDHFENRDLEIVREGQLDEYRELIPRITEMGLTASNYVDPQGTVSRQYVRCRVGILHTSLNEDFESINPSPPAHRTENEWEGPADL